MRLNDLGLRHGTDKSSVTHDYLDQYEKLLTPIREFARCVIEIGVLDGASLKMWRDFFPNAEVIGIDIQEKRRSLADGRIKIEIGPQQDPAFLLSLVRKYEPDFVIDDGSHIWPHQITTFQALYPAVQTGGVYICEDLHTSRDGNQAKYGGGAKRTAASYFGEMAACLSAGGAPFRAEEDSFTAYVRETTTQMSFGRRFVAFQKKGAPR